MAGQLAHICLVNSICTPEHIDEVSNLTPSLRIALLNFTPFARLGAVSPDCPSLMGETDASGWNGVMHYVRPTDFVRYGIAKVLPMNFSSSDTRACLAWLFGYLAHLVTDYTVHPVIAALVGPYSIKRNRKFHRRCELDQDSYIFHKLVGAEITGTSFLDFTGLVHCGDHDNKLKLHPAIISLWTHCLSQYPRAETKPWVSLPSRSLVPNRWFATYLNVMANLATKNGAFVKLFGFNYRKSDELDDQYIHNLPTPNPLATISYDDLFAKTRANIIQAWSQLARAFDVEEVAAFDLPNGDLDSGKDANGKFLYWS
jgi:hypothetical protein